MKLKKIAAAALAIAISVQPVYAAEFAQVNEDPENTQVTDEVLNVGLASEPSTLWCAGGGKLENEALMIEGILRDTLVLEDPLTKEVKPNLSTEWERIDATHYRFTLRDDVTMSDGTPFTAEDVVYSAAIWRDYNAALDTGMYLEGAQAEDEHTVIIEFNVESPELLNMFALPQFGIVSEDEVNALGGLEAAQKNPRMGSGRYRFKEWENGEGIVLERNEEYWNPDYKGYFKEIVVHFTQDSAAREMAVEAGDSDIAFNLPVIQASAYAENENVKTYTFITNAIHHLWYNMGEKAGATKDEKVRKAIDKALDFDAIAKVATGGLGEQALAYVASTDKYYTATRTVEDRAVDVEGAKALLEEAGYGDGLELKILLLQEMASTATVMQANLANAGIKLILDTPDMPQFVEAAFAGDYDLIIVGDSFSPRIPSILGFMAKKNVEGGMIIGGPKWTTDEIDSLISDIVKESDEEKTKELLQKFEGIVNEQMIVSNLYTDMSSLVTARDIKGIEISSRGYLDLGAMYK